MLSHAAPLFFDVAGRFRTVHCQTINHRYSPGLIAECTPSDDFDHDMAVSSLPDHPDVWTDGSLVLDQLTGVSSSGSGFFAHQSGHFLEES